MVNFCSLNLFLNSKVHIFTLKSFKLLSFIFANYLDLQLDSQSWILLNKRCAHNNSTTFWHLKCQMS